jgi:signal transduction histidine kinase
VIEAANRITADRLHDRIPEHDSNDEIGRIITTLNKMISRLDVSFQQVRQFSADASHELRTPLAVLRSQLESALISDCTPHELKTIAASCLDETIRMTNIIENLLLLAQADGGHHQLRWEPVDLRALMTETVEESVVLASPRNITVSLKKADEAVIMGDEQRLRQMLLNLIDNAIKYNRPEGTIDCFLERTNGEGTITIADSGIGIPPSETARIFDRFYRVDKARNREIGGAGLGLSIVRWIVDAHGGTIRVLSRVDEGSKFVVGFPIFKKA